MFNQRFGVRAQFRGLVFAAPSFMNETFRSNTTHHMAEPTFGFLYRFWVFSDSLRGSDFRSSRRHPVQGRMWAT